MKTPLAQTTCPPRPEPPSGYQGLGRQYQPSIPQTSSTRQRSPTSPAPAPRKSIPDSPRDETIPPLPKAPTPAQAANQPPAAPATAAATRLALLRRKVAGRRKLFLALPAILVVPLGLLAGRGENLPQTEQPLVFHQVRKSDLAISVTERGSLVSQQETRITCDVETVPGQPGTRIVYIVPNGKSVKQGDLLVEFDAAPLRERVDNQVLAFEQSKASQIQSNVRYENQTTQNETSLAAAELRVELAELNQKMYLDGDDGTYRLALQEIEQRIQEARNRIVEAQAELDMQATSRNGIETLYKLGYRGKGDLDQAVHKHLQADDALLRATGALANAIAGRKKLEQFEHPMRLLELQGSLNTARRALLQVQRDNQSYMAQAQAAKTAADRALAKEEEKLLNYQAQLEKCKILAPHDGMVAYTTDRTPWGRNVAEGELVVERFKILALPDLGQMQVKTAIHESVLDKVHEGLPATVSIDALDQARYRGTVRSVAVLPSQDGGMSADVKVYEAIVTIDEPVKQLKPGMTAVVEIHVQRLNDVLSLPMQAIVQTDNTNWCYVAGKNGLARRPISVGATNDMFAEITSGLAPSDRVVMNPMAIIDGPQ